MIPRSFIMHTPDGAYACNPIPIDNFEDTLRQFFGNERRLAKGVFALEGDPVDVANGDNDALCSVRLKEFPVTANYKQVGDFLVPTFAPQDLRMTLPWPVPGDMNLHLAALLHYSSTIWSAGDCFLFIRRERGFLKLPLPNTYSDGRICMGDRVVGTLGGNTVQNCFKAAVESFRQTSWNSDILEHPDKVQRLFRWTPDRKPVPPPADWHASCQTVSRPEMEELCPA